MGRGVDASGHVTKALFLCEINTCKLNAARKVVSSRAVGCAGDAARGSHGLRASTAGNRARRTPLADLKTNLRTPLIRRIFRSAGRHRSTASSLRRRVSGYCNESNRHTCKTYTAQKRTIQDMFSS